MISLACATRRPEAMKRALQSALDLAAYPDSLQIILRQDYDGRLFIPRKSKNDFVVFGPRLAKGAAPHVNQAAMAATGDVVMQFTDDQLVCTPEWDRILQERMDSEGHKPTVLQVQEGRKQLENPVVNREWLRVVGHLYPPELIHFFSDTYVEAIAQKAGRLIKVDEVEIVHRKGLHSDETARECRIDHSGDAARFIALRERIESTAERVRNASF